MLRSSERVSIPFELGFPHINRPGPLILVNHLWPHGFFCSWKENDRKMKGKWKQWATLRFINTKQGPTDLVDLVDLVGGGGVLIRCWRYKRCQTTPWLQRAPPKSAASSVACSFVGSSCAKNQLPKGYEEDEEDEDETVETHATSFPSHDLCGRYLRCQTASSCWTHLTMARWLINRGHQPIMPIHCCYSFKK